MSTQFDDALAELDRRLEQSGIHARVYVRDGMTAIMVHPDGDTTATIDQALEDETGVVGEMAAEIGSERGLPEDWLRRVGTKRLDVSAKRRMTIRERMLHFVLRLAAGLAERCVTIARQPDAIKIKKRGALVGIRMCRVVVKLARRFFVVRN